MRTGIAERSCREFCLAGGMAVSAVANKRRRAGRPRDGNTAGARPGLLVSLLLAGLVASGCHPYPGVPYGANLKDRPVLGRAAEDHAVIRCLLATDRRETGSSIPRLFFGIERTHGLTLGRCDVTVPGAHYRGRLETPALLSAGKPGRHLLLTAVETIDRPAWIADLRERLAGMQDSGTPPQVLVFVHGYAVTFEDAARRAAQIAHDTDFNGVPIVYSWSTQGTLLSYLVDATNADWTVPYFVAFLELLVDDVPECEVNILAHSMGTRVVSEGVREFMLRHGADYQLDSPDASPLDQVILAAADIDAELFSRDFAPPLKAASRRVTLYVSAADWALASARWLHKYARLGQATPVTTQAVGPQRMELVDATRVDKGVVGHMYYASSPTVLEDLDGVLRDQSPAERGLKLVDGVYRLTPRYSK